MLTEGLLSISNLIVLFNDQLIRRELSKGRPQTVNHDEEFKLKLFLTILENIEVFIEITSQKVLGTKKKFIIIFLIQAVKCIGRLVLVLKFKNRISTSPALEQVNRKHLERELITSTSDIENLQPEFNESSTITLKLKRSGKIIRKVNSQTPPLYARSFKTPELEPTDRFGSYNHHVIKKAEIIYILKPMIHLGSIGLFGYKSWKSYLLSMFFDLFSIRQYYSHRQSLTTEQKKEMSRRCVNLILYILRSPFYDQFSGRRIDSFMKALNIIPFAKLIVEPYREYLPRYQDTYFYMWSS